MPVALSPARLVAVVAGVAVVVIGGVIAWAPPAHGCLFPPADDGAGPLENILSAPPGGAWWLRGVPESAAMDLEAEDRTRRPAVIMSTGGLTTWAIAVPLEAAPGASFHLTSFRPDGFDEWSEPGLVVAGGAPAPEGDLVLTPRITFVADGARELLQVWNPLSLFETSSCELGRPLLSVVERGTTMATVIELDGIDAERVVVDAGFGDLDAGGLVVNAEHRRSIRLNDDDDAARTGGLRVRARSVSTGAAGPVVVVPIRHPPPAAPQLSFSTCSATAAADAPLLVALLTLAGARARRGAHRGARR